MRRIRDVVGDLHDAALQRPGVASRVASGITPDGSDLHRQLADVGDGVAEACEELRQVSHGIRPAVLTQGAASGFGCTRQATTLAAEIRCVAV